MLFTPCSVRVIASCDCIRKLVAFSLTLCVVQTCFWRSALARLRCTTVRTEAAKDTATATRCVGCRLVFCVVLLFACTVLDCLLFGFSVSRSCRPQSGGKAARNTGTCLLASLWFDSGLPGSRQHERIWKFWLGSFGSGESIVGVIAHRAVVALCLALTHLLCCSIQPGTWVLWGTGRRQ
mgnify:CR=1 FL=1